MPLTLHSTRRAPRSSRSAFVAVTLLAATLGVRHARADVSANGTAAVRKAVVTKAECVEADTASQVARRAAHYRASREQLQICSDPACPKLVHDDCAQRLSDLDAVIPTLVFAAKDAAGEDLAAVRVTMDGTVLATELSGTAVALDPGLHAFRFDTGGAAPVEKKVVVREGDRGRQELVVFKDLNVSGGAPLAPTATASRPVLVPEPSGATAPGGGSSFTSRKTVAVVTGAVGLAGVAVGAVFGSLSFSAWSSSRNECGGSGCSARSKAVSDHDSAVHDATVSDVGFVAGGALVAAGVVLYLTAPPGAAAKTNGLRLAPSVGPELAGVRLEGSFR